MDPNCGYSVVASEQGLETAIVLKFGSDDPLLIEVWRKKVETYEEQGEFSRQWAFWWAVAHFANSGGDVQQLAADFRTVSIDIPQIDLPEGMFLLRTIQQCVEPQHIFIDPVKDSGIIWSEGFFAEECSCQQILNEDARQECVDD